MLDFALDSRSCPTQRQGKETETIVAFVNRALLTLKRILIVIGIAIAFSIGLIGAIVLSLSSSKTTVPNIVGKDRITAENEINAARLNFRVRATRPASDAQPNTVLIQIPGAGQEVKVGQTVAVDISRPTKEGETSTTEPSNTNTATEKKSENASASNSSANSNDNKPKKKPANANSNGNANGNGNRNANRVTNQNRNANANRATTTNTNANPGETPARNQNTNRTNLNTNRRPPAVAPTP
ncbi:MAG TPA: PASTA domain-containing protein [Pyrinomonadaceae bacterium]|nr:PASTA domain-containing protein [Pyrinomonadaceae bacterium]